MIHAVAVAATLAGPALSWNTDVHQQIAYAADELLNPWTKQIIKQLLEPSAEGSLGRVGAWADGYRKTPEGAYTNTWHYIDPADEPPSFCNVHFNRDCTKGGCIVSALTNQTEIVKGCISRAKLGKIRNGEDYTCANAVKFLAHFTADIAQPLHVSGIAAGGNGFPVTFNGTATNLHSVWDGAIIYAKAGVTSFNNATIQPFFKNAVKRLRSDDFITSTADMLACSDPGTPHKCAMEWARDTNEWTCDYVYSQIFNGTDLATSGYAKGAGYIVEVQTAKAALRMATYFNRLVEGNYRQRDVYLETVPSWILGPAGGI
ncbi:nuclease PA3 [Microdochium trichocladiopsis]|uniref:Nuclease PA3 n=1 Tax=Microdochium trichocladiopsis TaxID=1682393 RepID=A0A9P8Y5I0_9PEZI|nr:nuclease PA3 [Microdochium trichocladiopsis]KAH7028010.1 nuclease PA3 [Microdochium trichocladiopsis]